MMSLEQMEGIIEAVLFTMGDSVEAGKLADAICFKALVKIILCSL